MHAVEFQTYGTPSCVAEPVMLKNPDRPTRGKVLVKVEACPINPSDLLRLRGLYGDSEGYLGRTGAGSQGVGRIAEVGPGVTHLNIGDLVPLHIYFAKSPVWREYIEHTANGLNSIPEGDLLQLSMTPGNPPSAWLILNNYMTLNSGDWIIQNAANSTVGCYINQLAALRGINVINVVRSESSLNAIKSKNVSNAFLDNSNLPKNILKVTGGARPKLAIDAVAGDSSGVLMNCLEDKGLIINYGMLSGSPITFDAKNTIFRDIQMKGFWLQRWWGETDIKRINELTQLVAKMISEGSLSVPVDRAFSFKNVRKALERVEKGASDGKVFLVPPGSPYLKA